MPIIRVRTCYKHWYIWFSCEKDFITLKDEVDKLEINDVTNVPTSLNNLKTKLDDLDGGKLKTVPVDLKKLNDVADSGNVKNTKFNTLKAKVNSLEKKSSGATTLILINQYNTEKQNFEKKLEVLMETTKYDWFSDNYCFKYKN